MTVTDCGSAQDQINIVPKHRNAAQRGRFFVDKNGCAVSHEKFVPAVPASLNVAVRSEPGCRIKLGDRLMWDSNQETAALRGGAGFSEKGCLSHIRSFLCRWRTRRPWWRFM
jgi:hypothetical protein